MDDSPAKKGVEKGVDSSKYIRTSMLDGEWT
jgi:hypothetical protein